MKAMVIYDSLYGNTEKIARAIGGAITGEVIVARVGEVNAAALQGNDLLIIGSPTQGGRATIAVQDLISKIPVTAIKGKNVAAFDTRLSTKWVGIFGYAAGKIAGALKARGGVLVVPPEAFFVAGKEGPLKQGELERAEIWAKQIAKSS